MINLSAKIYINDSNIINVDNSNMVYLDCPIFDREKNDIPSWGIVSNKGKMRFYDTNFEVQNLIDSKSLNSSNKIEIYLNNTIAKKSNKVGEFSSSTWNYDNDSRLVYVDFFDDLTEWQEIIIPQIEPTVSSRKNIEDLFNALISLTPYKWTFEVDDKTLNHIKSIKIDESNDTTSNAFYYLNRGSLWVQWDKFCKIAMLHIYKKQNGNVVIKHSI